MIRTWNGLAVLVALIPALFAEPSLGAQGAPLRKAKQEKPQQGEQPLDPLGLQKLAYRKFAELKQSMRRLSELLAETEKSKSRRLKSGLRLLKEKEVERTMREIEKLISDEAWLGALDSMKQVQLSLGDLLRFLMERDEDLQEILEKIERLEAFKNQVEKLLEEQRQETGDSSKADDLEKHLEELAATQKKLDELIGEQQALKGQTEDQGTGKKESSRLARKQGELGEDAESLEAEIKRLEEQAEELAKDDGNGDGKGNGNGDGKGTGSGKGSGAMGKAADSMAKAQSQLENQAPESALDEQEDALEELQEAKQALEEMEEEARRKLLEIPFERLSKEQLETMRKTDNLAKKMEDAEAGDAESGESGDPVPGRKNVEQAVPKQRNGAGSLKESKPGKAKQDQQDAEDELEEAKKKLEDALSQLRQELQEEVLKALEERFTEMLEKQKQLSQDTILTDKRRDKLGMLTRAGRVPSSVKRQCERLSNGELTLQNGALAALRLLEDDGTSAVFPEIVKELAEQLGTVGNELASYSSGPEVQSDQKNIEKLLESLIEALIEHIEYNDNRQPGEP
ncbi:MAG: hypothetical protein ACE5F1_02110 [Planctomycetota bacterium]